MARQTTQQSLGSLLRERRHRARLTQQEVAQRLGMTREWLGKLEKDEISQPNVDLLNRLATILPVSVLEIVVAVGYNLDAELREEAAFFAELLDAGDEAAEDVRARFRRLQRRLIGGDDEPLPSA